MDLIDRGGALEPKRAIARGMVSLFKEYVGRGPTDARAFINDGLVVVLLRDTLTTAEKTLAHADDEDLVLQLRRSFQGAMRDDAIALVERETGQRVVAFMSDNSVEPDYAAEIFVLRERDDRDGAGRARGDAEGSAGSDGAEQVEAAAVPGGTAP